MVSTTLTTLAAGQTGVTSSSNHHHHQAAQPQQQQQQPSSHHTANSSHSLSYQRQQQQQQQGHTSSTGSASQQNRSYYSNSNRVLELNGLELENTACDNSSYQQRAKETCSTAASSAAVNLSQSLLSASPPLNEQINLLFPKCRPKQTQSQQPAQQQQQQRQYEAAVNLNSNNNNSSSSTAIAEPAEPHCNGSSSTPTPTPTPTLSYYKSVNIITQSPPPHSGSSHSSESLSSVTPRISTNPFLCAPLTPPSQNTPLELEAAELIDEDEQQLVLEQQQQPVPPAAYPASFYYHTGSGEHRRGHNSSSYNDMPRKRSSAVAASSSYKQQPQQQHMQHMLLNGNAGNSSNGNASSQNPFIKENLGNYWETANAASRGSSALLHSPTDYAEDQQLQQQQQQHNMHGSARRAFHQQQQLYNMTRQPTQPPHIIRVGRSPVNRGYTPPQQNINPCAEGLTPLASHYLYGSKSSLDIQQQQPHGGDWEPREQRKLRQREEREREREREREHMLLEQHQQQLQEARDNHMAQLTVNQQQRKRHDERERRLLNGSSSNDVALTAYATPDVAESWQHLRVTTETNGAATPVSEDSKPGKLGEKPQTILEPHARRLLDDAVTGAAMYREHKAAAGGWQLERNYTLAMESRHGIIEYEGSPRRIGASSSSIGTAAAADESESPPAVPQQQQQQQHQQPPMAAVPPMANTASTLQKSAARAALAALSQQPQAYPVRPGFPQRIISPPREARSNSPLPHYNNNGSSNHSNNNNKQQQLQQLQQQQQQAAAQQTHNSMRQQTPSDNNAEDTSNDVSEIGTISDLTTPEAVAVAVTAVAAVASTAASDLPCSSPPTPPAPTPVSAAAPILALPTLATATGTSSMAAPPNCSNGSALAASTISTGLGLHTKSSTFDYLYEFSETRKVLEEFFKCPSNDEQHIMENGSDVDSIDIQYEFHSNFERDEEEVDEEEEDDEDAEVEDEDEPAEQEYRQQQAQQQPALALAPERHNYGQTTAYVSYQQQQPKSTVSQMTSVAAAAQQPHNNYNNQSQSAAAQHRRHYTGSPLMRDFDFFLDSASRSSGEPTGEQDGLNHNQLSGGSGSGGAGMGMGIGMGIGGGHNNYRYSPETTDYDSNCGDLDSEYQAEQCHPGTADPQIEHLLLAGLSGEMNGGVSTSCSNYAKYYASAMPVLEDGLSSGHTSDTENNNNKNLQQQQQTGQQPNQQQTNSISGTSGSGGISMLMDMKRISTNNSLNSMHNLTTSTTDSNGMAVNMGLGSHGMGMGMSPQLLHHDIGANGGGNVGYMSHNQSSPKQQQQQPPSLLGQSPSNNSNSKVFKNIDPDLDSLYSISVFHRPDMVQMTPPPPAPAPHRKPNSSADVDLLQTSKHLAATGGSSHTPMATAISSTLQRNSPTAPSAPPPKPRSAGSNCSSGNGTAAGSTAAVSVGPPPIPERSNMLAPQRSPSPVMNSPVWLSRHLDGASKALLESSSDNHSKNLSADEDDVDTDLETDRLLGHQRLDDQGYYDENKSWERKPRGSLLSKISPKQQQLPSTKTRNGYNALLSSTPELPPPLPPKSNGNSNGSGKLLDLAAMGQRSVSRSSSEHSEKSPLKAVLHSRDDCGGGGGGNGVADVATVPLGSPGGSEGSGCISSGTALTHKAQSNQGTAPKLELENSNNLNVGNVSGLAVSQSVGGVVGNAATTAAGNGSNSGIVGVGVGVGVGIGGVGGGGGGGGGGSNSSGAGSNSNSGEKKVKKSKSKEGGAVLIEGVLFRAKYLGSTQLVCEGQPTKSTRMMQAEEAVSRIKALAPDGDVQPSTEVDLFISTEKIMVLNTDLKEIMMDHALRTISYIADIGDLVVLMARRRFVPQDIDDAPKPNRTPKMICHVFESDEAQFIAQSIGQAFQVAYMEFLKANGIEDHRFVKEMDYQEVLNSQEIFGDELEIFAKKELQKEVVVPKAKGEILGVVIVESGWGSMLPTVVIANLMSSGAAARCGQLNIGDQLIAINGLSLVGLPLSTCQTYIKNTKNQTVVKFTVVPCAPVVEVKIKRPETKYQLGFSVQNGVICSLLRGGIAERGGVRVGHRIIEINNQSVVAVPHEKIVNLLATSVGEILMKTMPTSMFRLLTGQENPIYI